MKGKFRFFYGEFIQPNKECFKVIAKLSRSINEQSEILGKSFTVVYNNDVFKPGDRGRIKYRMPDVVQLYETIEDCVGDHFEKFL